MVWRHRFVDYQPPRQTDPPPEIAKNRYRVPLWPPLAIAIELPPDFIGMVAEVKLAEDSPDGRGWKPPLTVTEGAERRAHVRPDAHGVVSYPATIAGVTGFGFQDERIFRRDGKWLHPVNPWDSLVLLRGGQGAWAHVPIDPLEVHAWEIAMDQYPSDLPNRTSVMFVGSLVDLRAWIVANALESGRRRLKCNPTDVAAFREFSARSVLKIVLTPEPVIPEWQEVACLRRNK